MTIDGGPVYEGDCMIEEGFYLSVFYCLCFVKEISTDMLGEQSREKRESGLEVEESIMLS